MTFDSARAAEDSALLEACREGDQRSFATLWERHHRAGRSAARSIAPHLDADDLVAEAYTRILALVQRGKGPTGAFRPYLYRVITSLAADWSKTRETSSDELDSIPDLAASGPWEDESFDHRATATAFASLQARWQAVLWYTEVEGLAPREVASIIGISANSVSALAGRARDGLRSAWVEAHINTTLADEACTRTLTHLQRHQRGKLTAGLAREVDDHLAGCPRCRSAARECSQLNEQLALVLLWVFVGGGAATALYAALQPAAATAGVAAASFPGEPGSAASMTTAASATTASAAGASAASITVIAGGSALALAVAAGVGAWALSSPLTPPAPVAAADASDAPEVAASSEEPDSQSQPSPPDEEAALPNESTPEATALDWSSPSNTVAGTENTGIAPGIPSTAAPEASPPIVTPPIATPPKGTPPEATPPIAHPDPELEPGPEPAPDEEDGSGSEPDPDPTPTPGEDASLSPGSACFLTAGSSTRVLLGATKHAGVIRVRVTTESATAPLELWVGEGHTTAPVFGGLWFTPSLATLADWGAPEITFEMLTSIEVQLVAADGRYSPWQQVDRGDRC